MIIDMHAHVWRNRQEQSLRTIRRAADIYHLDKVLISGLGSYSPDQAEISLLNAAVAAICEEDPLFAGYVYVDPLHQDAMDTLQYWLPHPCMVGMKLWVSCRCDETACDSLYEYCAAEKAPVLIHAFEKAAGQLPGSLFKGVDQYRGFLCRAVLVQAVAGRLITPAGDPQLHPHHARMWQPVLQGIHRVLVQRVHIDVSREQRVLFADRRHGGVQKRDLRLVGAVAAQTGNEDFVKMVDVRGPTDGPEALFLAVAPDMGVHVDDHDIPHGCPKICCDRE